MHNKTFPVRAEITKIVQPFADERFSQSILDFLTSTEVGKTADHRRQWQKE